MKNMNAFAHGGHGHDEIWNLVPDLTPQLEQLALDLLPAMKRYKRLLILIGASSLNDGSEKHVRALADELALVAVQSGRFITVRHSESIRDGLVGQILLETKVLGRQASRIALHGVDGEAARSLRNAYRALRNSCTALWQFEFVPEGNPLTLAAGGRS